MAEFKKFSYKSIEELESDIASLGVDIPVSRDFSVLSKPVMIGAHTAPNALAVLPMEGYDSLHDGSPSELTLRRYIRYGAGGAGLIWFEACSVVEEGKSNPCCMWISENNVSGIAKMVQETDRAANTECGHKPIKILQLTHSGRYSRPHKAPEPVIVKHDPGFDERVGIDSSYPTVTDEELDALIPAYVNAAKLAKQAGFEGVDIKACHRYLISEMLSCYDRPGKYGGSLENRAGLLINIIKQVRKACGADFIIAVRFNMYDDHPYPIGFGASPDGGYPDITESMELVKMLAGAGVNLISASAGDVRNRPCISRPYDISVAGGVMPHEHQLISIARMLSFSRKVKAAVGDIPVLGGSYSWLRQFLPNVGAAVLASGGASMIGFGRGAFAYPDMPKDIFANTISPNKCCTACSKCTQLMRDHGKIGCPVRDSQVYAPLYRQYRELAKGG